MLLNGPIPSTLINFCMFWECALVLLNAYIFNYSTYFSSKAWACLARQAGNCLVLWELSSYRIFCTIDCIKVVIESSSSVSLSSNLLPCFLYLKPKFMLEAVDVLYPGCVIWDMINTAQIITYNNIALSSNGKSFFAGYIGFEIYLYLINIITIILFI